MGGGGYPKIRHKFLAKVSIGGEGVPPKSAKKQGLALLNLSLALFAKNFGLFKTLFGSLFNAKTPFLVLVCEIIQRANWQTVRKLVILSS